MRRALSERRRPRDGYVEFVGSLGFELTSAQTVLARVAFDGWEPRELRGEERELARTLFGDVDEVPRLARAVLVAVLGARSGKSLMASLRLLHLALTVDLSRLAPGEVAVGLIVCPDVRLSRQSLRYVAGALRERMPRLLASPPTADAVLVQRPDGRRVSIEALPASRGGSAVRGRSLVGAVLDESAFFLNDDGAYVVTDEDTFKAVTVRVVRGGQVLVASTPWARAGLLFDLFDENHGRPTTALAARGATTVMRAGEPAIEAIVERERRRDPGNAAREYDAEFVDSSASLLSSEDVRACVDEGVRERPPRPDGIYAVLLDVGLRNDRTACAVVHVAEKSRGDGAPTLRQLVVDALRVLKPAPGRGVSLDDVERVVAGLVRRYRHVVGVFADIHFADALRPRFEQRAIKFVEMTMAPSAQENRAKSLAALVGSHAAKLLDDPDLVSELQDLKVQRHAGGRVSVGAIGKRHDDVADTMLLAVDGEVMGALPSCGGDAGRVEFRPGALRWGEEGLTAHGGRWVRVNADGSEELAGTPAWAEGAEQEFEELRAEGIYTPESMRFFHERDGGLNVRIGE